MDCSICGQNLKAAYTKSTKTVHKVYWYSNEKTGSPVIFAGEVSECGSKWSIGARKWKDVNCKRCLAHAERAAESKK